VVKRSSFESMNCSLARSLEIVGEWWTLLIIREAIWGTTRFDDFHHRLGIARNILSSRLSKLQDAGVIERKATGESTRVYDYLLTDKGWDLFAVVVSLMQWGDRWIHADKGPPIQFFDRAKGQPIQAMVVRDARGRPLRPDQIEIKAGPGARRETVKRAAAAQRSRDGPAAA
jgi:DNA-binding HxlR family transcriptional regulator